MRSRGLAAAVIAAVSILLLLAAGACAVPSLARGAPSRVRGVRPLRAPQHPLYAPHPSRTVETIAARRPGSSLVFRDGASTGRMHRPGLTDRTDPSVADAFDGVALGTHFMSRQRRRAGVACRDRDDFQCDASSAVWRPRFIGDGTTVVTLRDVLGEAEFNVSIHKDMAADAVGYPYDDGFAIQPGGRAVVDVEVARAKASPAAAGAYRDVSADTALSFVLNDAASDSASGSPPPVVLLSVSDDDVSDIFTVSAAQQRAEGNAAESVNDVAVAASASSAATGSHGSSKWEIETIDTSIVVAVMTPAPPPRQAAPSPPEEDSRRFAAAQAANNTTGGNNSSASNSTTNASSCAASSNNSTGGNNSSSNGAACSTAAPTAAPGTAMPSTTTRPTTTTRSTTTRSTTTRLTTSTTSTTTTPTPTNATTTTTAAPTPAPTPAPPTPQPPPPPPKTGWRQVDVQFQVFHDARVADYLRLVAELAGVSVAQFRIVPYFGLPSVLNGRGYVMTVEFYDPLPNTTGSRVVTPATTVSAATAAIRLEAAVLARLDPRLEHFTIVSAARVAPAVRGVEDNVVGVNVLWLGLLLLSFLLVIFSVALLFRRRNSVEEDLRRERDQAEANGGAVAVDEEGEIEVEIPVPPDESHLPRKQLVNLVDRACQRHEEVWGAKQKETGASILQGLDSFEAALGYEQRLRLPPRGLILPTRGGPKKKLDEAPPAPSPDILTAMTTSTDGGDRDTQGDSDVATSLAPTPPANGATDAKLVTADAVEMTDVKTNPIAPASSDSRDAVPAPQPPHGTATVDDLLLSLGSAVARLPPSLPPKAKLPAVGVLPPAPAPPALPPVDPATLLGIFSSPPSLAAVKANAPPAKTAKDATNDEIFAALMEGAPTPAAAANVLAAAPAAPTPVAAADSAHTAPPPRPSVAPAVSPPAANAPAAPGVATAAPTKQAPAATRSAPPTAPAAKVAAKAPVASSPPPLSGAATINAASVAAAHSGASIASATKQQGPTPVVPKPTEAAPAVVPPAASKEPPAATAGVGTERPQPVPIARPVAAAVKTPAPAAPVQLPRPAPVTGVAPSRPGSGSEALLPEHLLPPIAAPVAPPKAQPKPMPRGVDADTTGFRGPPVPAAAAGGAKFTTNAVTDPADLLLSPEVVAAALAASDAGGVATPPQGQRLGGGGTMAASPAERPVGQVNTPVATNGAPRSSAPAPK